MFEGYVGKRVKKSDWEPGDIPYVTASVTNNGIDGYIGNPIIVKENLLTVNFFGDVYYQEGKISFKDGTYGLKLRNKREECRNVYLGLATYIQKQTLQMGSYDKGLRLDDIKNIIIELPVLTTEDTEPYWDYMAYYIHNIQQQYADQLEAKSEYELNLMCQILGVRREEIVQRVEFTQPKYTNTFRVDELFEGYAGKRVKKGDWEPGNIPYVTATVTNNGIDGYIGNPIIVKENLLTVNFFGDVFYQEGKVSFKDGTYGLKLRNKIEESKAVYLGLATHIQKQTKQMGSYEDGLRLDDIKNIILELPVLAPNSKQIDWGAITLGTVGGGVNYLATRQEICNRDLAIIRQLIQ